MSDIIRTSLEMQASQKQQLSQRMMMSAHMQQAIRVLQIPLQELAPFIDEELVHNPILEISTDSIDEEKIEKENFIEKGENEIQIDENDYRILENLDVDFSEYFNQNELRTGRLSGDQERLQSFIEQSICAQPSLHEKLWQQCQDSFENANDLEIARILIGYIDSSGLLQSVFAEICFFHNLNENEMRNVLRVIQTFEPNGVGASTIQESLLIQLRSFHKESTIAYRIVSEFYDDLLHNRIPLIQKKIKKTYLEIQEAIEKDILPLDLHPGTQFSSKPVQAIIPDVILRQENEQLIVDVDRDYAPRLRVNKQYLKMLRTASVSQETKTYIKQHLISARWLMRNLQERYSTIERIAQSLVEKQYDFFMYPEGKLSPLTMKALAEELGVHESTIARTVSNKYIYSPRGLFPLRSFFTTGYVSEQGNVLSATTVKQAILMIVENEDKSHPLSDDKISILLKDQGILCARRTIAKYRSLLQIGNTHQRKKFSNF
jgi:RNA polymerase sigma-54 factor